MRTVMEKKQDNLYQVACLRLFEGTHKHGVAENVGNHPNSYFTSSLQFKKASEKAVANQNKTQDQQPQQPTTDGDKKVIPQEAKNKPPSPPSGNPSTVKGDTEMNN